MGSKFTCLRWDDTERGMEAKRACNWEIYATETQLCWLHSLFEPFHTSVLSSTLCSLLSGMAIVFRAHTSESNCMSSYPSSSTDLLWDLRKVLNFLRLSFLVFKKVNNGAVVNGTVLEKHLTKCYKCYLLLLSSPVHIRWYLPGICHGWWWCS